MNATYASNTVRGYEVTLLNQLEHAPRILEDRPNTSAHNEASVLLPSTVRQSVDDTEAKVFIGMSVTKGGDGIIRNNNYVLFKLLPASDPDANEMFEIVEQGRTSTWGVGSLTRSHIVLTNPIPVRGRVYRDATLGVNGFGGASVAQCYDDVDRRLFRNIDNINMKTSDMPDVYVDTTPDNGGPLLPLPGDTLWDDASNHEAVLELSFKGERVPLSSMVANKDYLIHGAEWSVCLGTGWTAHPDTLNADDWVVASFDSDGEARDARKISRVEYSVATIEPRTAHYQRMWPDMREANVPSGLRVFKLIDGWETRVNGYSINQTSYPRVIASARAIVRANAERWDKMNEAMNELAVESDWCSEYEDSVVPLGFEGREDFSDVNYEVDVEVDFDMESFDIDNSDTTRLEYITGLDNVQSATIAVISGTLMVRVEVEARRSADTGDLEDLINTDMISNEINASGLTINDWTIIDHNEV